MKIYISGYESFDAWKRAGFPGARSFAPERKPDLRRGLCIEDGCENTDRNGWGGRCYAHAYLHDVARRSA